MAGPTKNQIPFLLAGFAVLVIAGAFFFFNQGDPSADKSLADAGQPSARPEVKQTDSVLNKQGSNASARDASADFATLSATELERLRQHPASVQPDNIAEQSAASVAPPEPVQQHLQTKTVTLPELPSEMIEEINRLSSRSTDGLYEEYQPDGSVHMDLQQRFQSVPIAVIDSDGDIHTFMHGDAYKPGPVEKTASTKDQHEDH